jgi:hypothetical protein
MRTSDVLSISLLALVIGLSPAVSFEVVTDAEAPGSAACRRVEFLRICKGPDGEFAESVDPRIAEPVDPRTIPPRPVMRLTPQDSFRSGTQLLRQGNTGQAVVDLEFAAEQGVPGAIWKLGRMYADGDGVKQNKARAYEYFRRLTTMHVADSAGTRTPVFWRMRSSRSGFTTRREFRGR